ncbi:hypothetical protein NP493_1350g00019 [Ridgeia piscesae]|uniref:28S rRNA (uridine-N(3))-methyltransferase n=1 Tax=Ridgeia piscesae TaxID=27915 RepID=A0AAD9K6F1_RIDPI|nr:hypothetical protein NP493_1350g00019 [Ridgeia piscesae]
MKQLEKQKQTEQEEVMKKRHREEEAEKKQLCGRHYTVSIALPGSILDNAQTPELRTYLAGQLARAAVVFNVDEIVIFDEIGVKETTTTEGEFNGVGKKGNASVQMARVLQYLECPQYLRKSFFPCHSDLKYAGLLNPLDTVHHVRIHDDSSYREGVVLKKPVKGDKGSFVNVGLGKEVLIDKQLKPGVRVTVKMDASTKATKCHRGIAVAPTAPRTETGLYWGYSVRLAPNLGAVFTGCPHKGGYDMLIGTSERGDDLDQFTLTPFQHLLVVFGGLQGLEASLDADADLKVDDPRLLFHHYLNTCPQQGSHTIRTEVSEHMSTARFTHYQD